MLFVSFCISSLFCASSSNSSVFSFQFSLLCLLLNFLFFFYLHCSFMAHFLVLFFDLARKCFFTHPLTSFTHCITQPQGSAVLTVTELTYLPSKLCQFVIIFIALFMAHFLVLFFDLAGKMLSCFFTRAPLDLICTLHNPAPGFCNVHCNRDNLFTIQTVPICCFITSNCHTEVQTSSYSQKFYTMIYPRLSRLFLLSTCQIMQESCKNHARF